jgi:hypothetical protein
MIAGRSSTARGDLARKIADRWPDAVAAHLAAGGTYGVGFGKYIVPQAYSSPAIPYWSSFFLSVVR